MSPSAVLRAQIYLALLILTVTAAPLRAEPTVLSKAVTDHLASLEILRGRGIDSNNLYGGPTIVAFFASWCAPCRAGFVEFRKLIDRTGPENVAIIAINWLEDAGHYPGESFRLQRLLDRVAPHITVVAGDKATSAAFGGVNALPTLFVFDSDGTETFRFEYDGVSPPSHPSQEELYQALKLHR